MTQPAVQPESSAPPGLPGEVERARRQLLTGVIAPVLETMGYELVHLEWTQSGRKRRLQVFVDHPDGFGLDDCVRLSPIVSNALDASEAEPGGGALASLLDAPYHLEVSSPGLERPLARRSHFARYVGRLVKLRVYSPLSPCDTQRNFHGRIEAALPNPANPDDDDLGTVCLRDPDDGREHRIPLERVRRAHLVYEG